MTLDPPLVRAVRHAGTALSYWSSFGPHCVAADEGLLLERGSFLPEAAARGVSRNRSCRLLRARDGWLAVNLPRAEDRASVPALLGEASEDCPWRQLGNVLAERAVAQVTGQASLLGMAVAALGETAAPVSARPLKCDAGQDSPRRWSRRPRVLDLSSLWAGPLCGAILAGAGCEVTRVECVRRPDSTRESAPAFHDRLNGMKAPLRLDLGKPRDRARLRSMAARSDVLITSARARALDSLGLTPRSVRGAGRGPIWIAITGYGLRGADATRVGFGDDCAVAGGLVAADPDGAPAFIADAVADPLTGLYAGLTALRALACGAPGVYDIALARTAALFAALRGVPQ